MIQPPQVRATVLSTIGQADAVGQVLGGSIIGLVAALTSPGLAIVAAGNALAPVAIILGRLSTRTGQPQVGGEPNLPQQRSIRVRSRASYRATSSHRLPLVATHAQELDPGVVDPGA